MEKLIKKWGDSLVLVFNADEKTIYKLHEGDVIDIELCKKKTVRNTR